MVFHTWFSSASSKTFFVIIQKSENCKIKQREREGGEEIGQV